MEKLENTPEYICDPGDTNYVIYMDTDSLYVHAEPILRHLYPDFDGMDESVKDQKLEEIALEYQDAITNYYDELAIDVFNVPKHKLEMKTEAVIRSAFFQGKRRYAQWITKKEGIVVDEIDVKGLDYMKSNFPPYFREFYGNILEKVLLGQTKSETNKAIIDFREKINNEHFIPISKPTGVKGIKKYTKSKPKEGQIFSTFELRAPVGVKATVRYNDLLKYFKLNTKYPYIVTGDKIKWVYLKDNPYKIDTLGFFDFEMPDEIREFIEEYVDKSKAFNTILKNKLEKFYRDLGWGGLVLNPKVEEFFSFE